MKTYFVKEYTTDFGRSVAVGYLDTDVLTEYGDHLARMVVFECDTDTAKVTTEREFIDPVELPTLAKISPEQYQAMEQAFYKAVQDVTHVVNKCVCLATINAPTDGK